MAENINDGRGDLFDGEDLSNVLVSLCYIRASICRCAQINLKIYFDID